jgi:hypothetical protein
MGVDVSFVLGYRNLIFKETTGSTLALTASGTLTTVSGAVGNLRLPQLSEGVVWRSSGTGDRRCTVKDIPDVATGRTVQLIALLGWDVQQTGLDDLTFTFEIQGSNTSIFAEPVTLPIIPAGMARHWFVLLPEAVEDVSYIEVFLDGTSTGGGGASTTLTLSAGALWAGPIFSGNSELDTLLAEGWEQEVLDPSDNVESVGGQGFTGPRPKRRVMTGSLVSIPYSLAYGSGGTDGMDLQAILYEIGNSQPVIILPRTTDPSGAESVDVMARLGVYGKMANLPPIRNESGNNYGWSGWRQRELL